MQVTGFMREQDHVRLRLIAVGPSTEINGGYWHLSNGVAGGRCPALSGLSRATTQPGDFAVRAGVNSVRG